MHRLPAQVKLTGLFVFVVSVVAIPPASFWAHYLAAALVAGVVLVSELPARTVLRRMAVEVPFLLFAALLPFVGGGERVDVLGISLSEEGLWGAWTIVAKATIGVAASVVLAATTTVPDLLRGLDRLRVPPAVTAIAGFMVRYVDIVTGEFTRRRVAMASRAYQGRWLWDAGPLAKSAASLFLRSFERGERLHQAMLSRGFTGVMPAHRVRRARPGEWAAGLLVPAAAALLAALATTVLK